MLHGFKQFILRGNVVELAVGVVIGAAFNNIVNSLVKDVLTPLIGAIAEVPDFSNQAFVLNGSKFTYGAFLNAAISFLLISIAVYFFVVVPMNKLLHRHAQAEAKPATKQCPQCLSEIPVQATRCSHCTQPVS